MTIDPTNPQGYRLRKGCEVVAIYPDSSGDFFVVYREAHGAHLGVRTRSNGRVGMADHLYDLIPHDPVLYYANAWKEGLGGGCATVHKCVEAMQRPDPVLARIAVHASGKVRQIPLSATTDPEGDSQ